MNWTRKEEERLEHLRLQGKTRLEISILLRRSIHSISGKCRELGITKPLQLLTLYYPFLKRIHSNKGLADKLGVSITAIKSARKRLRSMGYKVMASTRCINKGLQE